MWSFLVVLMCFIVSSNAIANKSDQLYVFAYSWSPQFCYGKTYPGCATPDPYWASYFTIHGLWPQYKAGGYPQTCTTEAFDSHVIDKIGWDTMMKYWPNVQASETSPDYTSFWEHEWSKHGTCSGLSQMAYFSLSLNLLQRYGTPASLTAAVGGTLSASQLRAEMGGAEYVSLQCTGGKYLNGAYSCWEQTLGVPVRPLVCPSDVHQEDTCTSETLVIQSF